MSGGFVPCFHLPAPLSDIGAFCVVGVGGVQNNVVSTSGGGNDDEGRCVWLGVRHPPEPPEPSINEQDEEEGKRWARGKREGV